MARIVRHNDESVREGYIRNVGKEVKLFTRALKAFQCNNRIVMAQRKHLDDFLRGRIIGRLECGRTQLEVSKELGIAQSVISRLWHRFRYSACLGVFQFIAPAREDCLVLAACYNGHSDRTLSAAVFPWRPEENLKHTKKTEQTRTIRQIYRD
ncbi:HTH_Tnp_Tc3_2 domain-containing protein [Trichonephila clavipes]|nr:HTH_Tnp_Tc3_2 domain-containing protein [Trichonephila clavipes]